jgi:hypothetical protein
LHFLCKRSGLDVGSTFLSFAEFRGDPTVEALSDVRHGSCKVRGLTVLNMKATMQRTLFLGITTAALLLWIARPANAQVASGAQETLSTSTVTSAPSGRLPLLGVMVDAGVPDGLIGSLTIRPQKWVRVSGGGGTNGISRGWRAGISLLPFGTGPSASFEYGRYQDGNANTLAQKIGLGSSPLLERIGYEYMNAHLGLDSGSRRFVVFLHGGVTMLRGQLHNLNAAIPASTIGSPGVTGTTQVVVPQDPNARAVGPSVKLGLIVYIL